MLSILILLPLLGALVIALSGREDDAKHIALFTTIVTFAASLVLWIGFDGTSAEFQFVEQHAWFADAGIGYYLGIDGISLFLVLLTTFLMPICILCSWQSIEHRIRAFMINFLILEAFVIGVFSSLDAIMFYLFFEGMLIPMYLIIGIWGGTRNLRWCQHPRGWTQRRRPGRN